ncbi:MAG: nucleotidyl transferase AbiEii/AbiGii toxin family protein [Ignavibacteriae bacterium]|nr:nucleotidyl transferase AbiEii/AbiGii toxin family protein [Ignavibacteriota bacterium]
MNWHAELLPDATAKCFRYLRTKEWLKHSRWYLAGGTALALQVGHRTSIDLDFFNPVKNFSSLRLNEHFPEKHWEATTLEEGTVYGKLFNCKVSFIAYPYFVPRYPFLLYKGVRVLDARDIAIMKIVAISQRGKKRDFIDLYWCCTNLVSLETLIEQTPQQYPHGVSSVHHILKSLTYFEDAENDPMPKLNFKSNWNGINKFFQEEVRNISKRLFRL